MCVGEPKKALITYSEVQKHCTPNDAWIVIRNSVYDVSNWHEHPGGDVMYSCAGEDGTDAFGAFHPSSATEFLKEFYIGELTLEKQPVTGDGSMTNDEKKKSLEKAYRNLRAHAIKAGLFESRLTYYVWKSFSNLGIFAAVVGLLSISSSLIVQFFAACLLGLFYQQCGWLSHDFLHHQVFENRLYGDMMGIFFGNVCQGFSVSWWKNKHNTHHAVPNMQDLVPDSRRADPDIDTMPLLAWSLRKARQIRSSSSPGVTAFMIRHQAMLYFPILFLARLSWMHQSAVHAFASGPAPSAAGDAASQERMWSAANDFGPKKYRFLEKMGVVLHHCIHFVMIFSLLPPLRGVLFFLMAQGVSGLLLALVFGVGHNGMQVHDTEAERVDFMTLQVTTTRNVDSSRFIDWFCGGLQYQVEHHLFPTMPRHNLGKIAPLTRSLATESGLKYHSTGLIKGVSEVIAALDEVSEEFIKEFPGL